jgi:cytochrome b subunit of formate dehydrogenase
MFRLSFVLVSFLSLVMINTSSHAASSDWSMAVDPENCLGCHQSKINREQFATSPHGKNGCTSCHLQGVELKKHMTGSIKLEKVRCDRCHANEAKELAKSVHGNQGLTCSSCHKNIHHLSGAKSNGASAAQACIKCHDKQKGFMNSVHGKALLKGNPDAPGCADCHGGLHSIAKIQPPTTNEGRMFHTTACLKCHSDEKKMEHNKVSTTAVETYLESYHGKSFRLGFPERAAGCSDCHTAHDILNKDDVASSVNKANLSNTCSQCHKKSTALFSKYYSHGSHKDSKNYPLLYWTFMAMSGLLIGTFAFFWVHTLLWMFRGFVENREKQQILAEGNFHHVEDGNKIYMRFSKRHIFLHFTVIISFLGLALTGLPLKFSDQVWAQTLMSFYGGVHYAGLIHRGCAILTFYYFMGAILMSLDFLILRKDNNKSFFARLFGPDSLVPNFRDLRDVIAMFKWFLFKGPKPTFDRWTYWEKFDFIAVFWGMFAIGGSGLMLWFPEFFGSFLPGWALNIATIIHSDEALLATGFIFTVHFFNTHGRPEKFPMDFVIFNGQITKEELIEERGDQWKRYEEEGITEYYACEKPSGVVYDFLFKGFGFIAVFAGLGLVIGMVYAFFK